MTFDKTTHHELESNNDNPVGYIALTPIDNADEKLNYFSFFGYDRIKKGLKKALFS